MHNVQTIGRLNMNIQYVKPEWPYKKVLPILFYFLCDTTNEIQTFKWTYYV